MTVQAIARMSAAIVPIESSGPSAAAAPARVTGRPARRGLPAGPRGGR